MIIRILVPIFHGIIMAPESLERHIMATTCQPLRHFDRVFADAGKFGGEVKAVYQDAH